MRTSGAPGETAMTYVPIVAGLILLVVMVGGPYEVLRALDLVLTRMVLTVRDSVGSWF